MGSEMCIRDRVKGHEKFNNLKLEDATKGIDVKFHPGAVKFFKEKGIDVA